jgi:hypothetical protein
LTSRTLPGSLSPDLSSKARTSAILSALATQPHARISVADIIGALRDRAFALLVVLLGLPNCLPMPPPIPLICGMLLAFVALQIIVGFPAPWLPQTLLRRSIARTDVERAVGRAVPVFRRLERFSKPRMTVFDTALAMRLVGLLLFLLALGLLFAPPLIGQIPLGIAVCLVGLGLVERDGIVVLGGVAIGSFGLTLSLGFLYAIVSGIDTLL